MDWGSFLGIAVMLTVSIVMLRLLWNWLVVLLLLGPPACVGMAAGHLVATHFNDIGFGTFTAVVVAGVITKASRLLFRIVR